eukprot:m.53748 g.53748  ORF g.53748 m.53748 type:complete len:61 (-) comp7682_c0_seq1:666-848(-)
MQQLMWLNGNLRIYMAFFFQKKASCKTTRNAATTDAAVVREALLNTIKDGLFEADSDDSN